MSPTPGTRLGPYEIVSAIGAGGMGEVYRAKDTKLNRDVAIKVLLGGVAHDAERRERFEREAQAIAALNHPNIVTIFGVESDGDTAFLAMELVEGKPLAECIPRGGLSLNQLLKIAIPVADAVAAAHQKGITHRDLKPANIMIGSGEHDGRVKVLDFGLAKLTGATPGGEATTFMPTALATGEGRILGTVAYMSPEQAEGKAIDARSDLFSIGVILYELATSDRPFTGDTSISIISSIVKDTPKSLTEINPAMPRDLARIVRRALAKDPEKRYQTAKDLRNDLEELKASLDSGELTAESLRSGAPVPPADAARWRWIAIGAIAVAVTAIGTATVMIRRGVTSTTTAITGPVTMTPLTSTGNAELGTISSDGKYVAYVQTDEGQHSVWIRQLASSSTVRIVPPTPGLVIMGLTIAPDASFVDVVRSRTAANSFPLDLWRVPFLGGAPRKIVDNLSSAPAWSPDGHEMAFFRNAEQGGERQLVVADADGSHSRVVAKRALPGRYFTLSLSGRPDLRPVWLPGGRTIMVMGGVEDGPNQFISVDVATGAEAASRSFSPAFTDGNTYAGFHTGMALGFDRKSVVVNAGEAGSPPQVVSVNLESGAQTRLTSDLSMYAGVSVAGDALVTTRYQAQSSVWVADAAGRNPRQIGRETPSELSGLSWIGTARIVFSAALAGGSGLWSIATAGGAPEFIAPNGMLPSATSDARTLVFSKGGSAIWRADGDGSHASIVPGASGQRPHISADGSKVFYTSGKSGQQLSWVIDLATSNARAFSSISVNAGGPAAESPDGRSVAFLSNDSAVVLPVDGSGTPRKVSIPFFTARLGWAPDSRGLAYVDAGGSNVWIQPIDGGPPRQVTTFTDRVIRNFAWSPDGKQLAVTRTVTSSDIVLLKGVR